MTTDSVGFVTDLSRIVAPHLGLPRSGDRQHDAADRAGRSAQRFVLLEIVVPAVPTVVACSKIRT